MASDAVVLRDTPGYRGDTQLYLNSFLIGFSTLFVGMRLYARGFMVKRLGVDDLLAVLCLGCLVSLSAMEIRLVQSGSGTHIRYVSETRLFAFFNALTTQSLLYFWCVCLMRLHIAAFLPNLHNDSKLSTTVLDFLKTSLGRPADQVPSPAVQSATSGWSGASAASPCCPPSSSSSSSCCRASPSAPCGCLLSPQPTCACRVTPSTP